MRPTGFWPIFASVFPYFISSQLIIQFLHQYFSATVFLCFSRSEICILQLVFHRLLLCRSICVRHQFCATNTLCIYASAVQVSLNRKKEFVKYLSASHLFWTRFSYQSFANTNNLPRTHQQKCISFFNKVFLKR